MTINGRKFIVVRDDGKTVVVRPAGSLRQQIAEISSRFFGHIGDDCDILHTDLSPGGTYWIPQHPLIAHSKEINTGAFVSTRRIFDYPTHVTTILTYYPEFTRLAIIENDDQPFSSFFG